MSRVVIAIHGVGVTEPGSVALALASQCRTPTVYDSSALVAEGHQYKVLSPQSDDEVRIVEVNWSDVLRPRDSLLDTVKHLVMVLLAMMQVAEDWYGRIAGFPNVNPVRWYRFAMEAVGIWAVALSWLIMLLVSHTNTYTQSIILLCFVIGLAVLTSILKKLSRFFEAGWLWVVASLLFGLYLICNSDNVAVRTSASQISSLIYSADQFIVALLLIIASVAVLFRRDSRPYVQRLAHAALLYVPFYGLSALVVIGSALGLVVGDRGRDFAIWESALDIRYNLGLLEAINTGAMALVGALALVAVVIYGAQRRQNNKQARPVWHSGRIAQDNLKRLLAIAPLIITGVALVYAFSLLDYLWFDPRPYSVRETGILNIYRISVLRIIPYVPFVIGPASVVLDSIGDVVFFLCPNRSPLAIRETCRSRFVDAMQYAIRDNDIEEIVIVSHSQGTVVAFDALSNWSFDEPDSQQKTVKLLTMGSPLASLYQRFLGSAIDFEISQTALPHWISEWRNVYRTDDFIAGPVAAQEYKVDEELGPGGHGLYWSDPAIGELIRKRNWNR